MRKQYHFKPSLNGYYAWDVDRLIQMSRDLPIFEVEISQVSEWNEPYWYGNGTIPTCRSVVDHMKLIEQCSLDFPIILSAQNSVMDGMHRVGKAYLEGLSSLAAVRFLHTPEPDFTDVYPDQLPYE